MDNLNYQFLDHDFSPAKAGEYTLLVLADDEQFSFAAISGNTLLALSTRLDWSALAEPVAENNLLTLNYGQRIIGLHGSGFTLVPVSVFNPDKAADFARFLDVKDTDKIFSQPLDAENQVIFKIAEKTLAAIDGKFDLNDVVFAPKGWIRATAGGNPTNDNLYLDISGDRVEILNFNDGKLRFYNSFGFENEDELAYFTSLVADELQLPACNLVLSGDFNADEVKKGRLSQFFGSIEINKLKPVKLPAKFAPHPVLTLTALSLCGSSAEH
jgi:hypothetical protein